MLVSTPATQPDGDVHIKLQVALNETSMAPFEDFAGAIRNLAGTAFEIIILFG